MLVICGAGLAGLSLGTELVRAGARDEIVIVDRRTDFGRDRTWCTWADPVTPWLHLARARWPRWAVATAAGRAERGSGPRPYVMLDSRDVYAAALEVLDAAPNVTLRLGEPVEALGDGWVQTAAGRLEGQVFDALALASPALRDRQAGAVELWQAFVGWEVAVQRPVFDPGVATLMDFRCPQVPGGVAFVYVLPFARDRALVEHTTFAPVAPDPEQHREALRAFLGQDAEVLHEELGRIPMTTGPLPMRRSARTVAIGTAGGAVRPSSGYAFTRITRQARAVAAAVVAGRPLPARAGTRRHDAMDQVFLRALAAQPGIFPELFRGLVAHVPGAAFARFMTDQSTPWDELRVIAATPKLPFIRAAASVRVP